MSDSSHTKLTKEVANLFGHHGGGLNPQSHFKWGLILPQGNNAPTGRMVAADPDTGEEFYVEVNITPRWK